MSADGTSDVSKSWVTDEIAARRKKQAEVYAYAQGGIEQLYEEGKIDLIPQGDRVLLRAVLALDVSDLTRDVAYDARQSIVHEVLAFGPGCEKYYADKGIAPDDRAKIGQHYFVVSAGADRLSKTDKSVRLWTTRVEDLVVEVRPRAL